MGLWFGLKSYLIDVRSSTKEPPVFLLDSSSHWNMIPARVLENIKAITSNRLESVGKFMTWERNGREGEERVRHEMFWDTDNFFGKLMQAKRAFLLAYRFYF